MNNNCVWRHINSSQEPFKAINESYETTFMPSRTKLHRSCNLNNELITIPTAKFTKKSVYYSSSCVLRKSNLWIQVINVFKSIFDKEGFQTIDDI